MLISFDLCYALDISMMYFDNQDFYENY